MRAVLMESRTPFLGGYPSRTDTAFGSPHRAEILDTGNNKFCWLFSSSGVRTGALLMKLSSEPPL